MSVFIKVGGKPVEIPQFDKDGKKVNRTDDEVKKFLASAKKKEA